jgi:hypothetical protein
MYPFPLITISQAAHTAHHAKHVIVGSIHVYRGGGIDTNGVVGDGEDESSVINTR